MRKRASGARGERGTRWNTRAGERKTGRAGGGEYEWDGGTRETERKKRTASIVSRSRVHPPRGPGPSRLNAVKLSSYSHKGNSLSQPVKYKRVFPAGRFSTPIVFWAGLLFSVAQPRRLLFRQQRRDRSLLLARTRGREWSSFIRATVAK